VFTVQMKDAYLNFRTFVDEAHLPVGVQASPASSNQS
jgi:hypothetical protein